MTVSENRPVLPETMRAVQIAEFGGPEVLTVATVPLPEIGDYDVLIEVAAAGVNRPDCLQRAGRYPPPPGASEVPGLEVAGTVADLGHNVTGLAVGDEVCALVAGGGYAEYCAAPAGQCLPVPHGIPLLEAAAIPETFFTVWTNLFERGRLSAGETVLIHGGASGIGTTAIQLAKAFGATVIATGGSDAKTSVMRELGADHAINYRAMPFPDAVRDATGSAGVDVILDIVGGAYLADNVGLLRDDGRLVVIGILGGSRGELDLGRVLRRRLTITGSTLRARPVAEKTRIAGQLREQVWPLLEAGRVRPLVQQWFALDEVHAAHRQMEDNATCGKLLLVPR